MPSSHTRVVYMPSLLYPGGIYMSSLLYPGGYLLPYIPGWVPPAVHTRVVCQTRYTRVVCQTVYTRVVVLLPYIPGWWPPPVLVREAEV